MLEKVDLTQKMEKDVYKQTIEPLASRIGELQRKCKELGIPILILFEGMDAAGKGLQIGKLIQAMDPRGFEVFPINKESEEEKMHPFLWRYWTKTPANGRIAILDGSWYKKVTEDVFDKKKKVKDIQNYYDEIRSFEEQLTTGGTCIIKLFLYIDKKEQKERFRKLMDSPSSSWRVTQDDLERNKRFNDYLILQEEMLKSTDTAYASWNLVAATDRRFATVVIYETVIARLEEQIKEVIRLQTIKEHSTSETADTIQSNTAVVEPVLQKVDLNKSLSRKEYQAELKRLQKRIEKLHGELYRKRIPVILGFEGWDAGGKGGAIKRLTSRMDPRGYVVHPTASPNDIEKAHHYLWRFWKNMPKDGHIALFDRTWYGRVMVERIEHFCSEEDWKRAYKEINEMENSLTSSGAIVLKFWMQIDKDEQKKRFEERQNNPEKQWKITDEDWRNREKWDAYEVAVNEMLVKTSTPDAPWIIVEGNDKYYARIKVLKTVVEAIEKRLKK